MRVASAYLDIICGLLWLGLAAAGFLFAGGALAVVRWPALAIGIVSIILGTVVYARPRITGWLMLAAAGSTAALAVWAPAWPVLLGAWLVVLAAGLLLLLGRSLPRRHAPADGPSAAPGDQDHQLPVVTECGEVLTLYETPLWGLTDERPIAVLGACTPALVVALNGGWAKIETQDGQQGYVETWHLAALE